MNLLKEGEQVDIFNGGGGLCLQLEQCIQGQPDQFVHNLLGLLRNGHIDCLGKKEEEKEEEGKEKKKEEEEEEGEEVRGGVGGEGEVERGM